MGTTEDAVLSRQIADRIRDFPDFPQPGILFRDITPVLADPALLDRITTRLAEAAKQGGASRIAGIESRGFLLGVPVALSLRVPFVPVRKEGKLPGETVAATYNLEYGTARLEMQTDAVHPGERVMLIDDLLATGGTAAAAAGLIESVGGSVSTIGFLIELSELAGRDMIKRYNILSLLSL